MNFFTNHFLKSVSVLLLGGVGFVTAQAEIITGTCGGLDTHFKLDTDAKTLIISGTSDTGTNDDVRDSNGNNFSFGSYSIDTIYVEGGIRSLGKRLFKGVEPKHVYLPCTIFGTNDYLFELADATGKHYTGYVLHLTADSWLASDATGKTRPTSTAFNGFGLPASSVKTDWDVHQYEWKQTKEATCLVPGTETLYCANAKCPASTSSKVYDTRVVDPHVTALTHVDAVVPSCLSQGPGVNDHYKCDGCGKIYSDASAKNETNIAALTGDFAYSATGIIQTDVVDLTSNNGKHVVYHTDAPSSNEYILYTPEQVGYTGTITEIAFRVVQKASKSGKSTVIIEMGTTDMTTFENGKSYSFGFTEVYRNTLMTIGQAVGWETIKLTKPFVYDGTKSLVVRVSHVVNKPVTGWLNRSDPNYNNDTQYYANVIYGYQGFPEDGYHNYVHSVAAKYADSDPYAAGSKGPKTACPHLPDTKFTFSTVSSHHFIHHEAIAANCTESGRINFEKCDICYNCFRSEVADRKTDNGKIAAADTLAAAKGHHFTHHEAIAATCIEKGRKGFEDCNVCNKYFLSEQADQYTEAGLVAAVADTLINALGHHFIHQDAVAATCTVAGHKSYDECDVCSNYFDPEQKELFTNKGLAAEEDFAIAALGHNIVTYDNDAAVRDEDGLYHTECTRCHDGEDSQRYAKVVISSKGYTTVFYEVPLHSEGDAAESFAVSEVKDDAFLLTPVENLGAGEGFVVKGTANAVYWFPEQDVEGDAKSLLGGTTKTTSCEPKEYYVLGVGANSQKIGFYPYVGKSLNAYKAYYKPADEGEEGGAAQMAGYRMTLKGSADAETAIEELNAEAAEEAIYDLSGRKVSSPKKGQPYIKAGKKIIF